MGVFNKQGVYWIDFSINGHRTWERVGADKRLAQTGLCQPTEQG